jgi:hypothetical protein
LTRIITVSGRNKGKVVGGRAQVFAAWIRKYRPKGFFFPLSGPIIIIIEELRGEYSQPPPRTRAAAPGGDMPKTAIWLIIIFTLLFILGTNIGELNYLNQLGNTI